MTKPNKRERKGEENPAKRQHRMQIRPPFSFPTRHVMRYPRRP